MTKTTKADATRYEAKKAMGKTSNRQYVEFDKVFFAKVSHHQNRKKKPLFWGLVSLLSFVMVGPTPQKSTLLYHYFMVEAMVWDASYQHDSYDFCRRNFFVLIRIKSSDPFSHQLVLFLCLLDFLGSVFVHLKERSHFST